MGVQIGQLYYITNPSGDAENARLEFARLEFAAQTRSKMQGWKMRENTFIL